MRARPTANDVVVNSHLVQKRYDFYGADTEGSPTRYVSNSGTIAAASGAAVTTGTAQAGASTTMTLAADASDVHDIFKNMTAQLASGTGSVQERTITAYDGTSKVATVSPRWRTNKALYSEQFDNAAWTKTSATVSPNVITAPDGSTSADKLVEAAASSSHLVRRTHGLGSLTIVHSVYAKAGERSLFTMVCLDQSAGPAFRSAHFDLSAGTVVSGNTGLTGSEYIEALENGWHRCSIVATYTGTNASNYFDFRMSNGFPPGAGDSYLGDGSSGMYFWGAQLEEASILGDYIKTEASTIILPDATTVYDIVDDNNASVVLAPTASSTDGQYANHHLVTTGGTGSGQDHATVSKYDGDLKLATLSSALTTGVDTTTTYKLIDRGY